MEGSFPNSHGTLPIQSKLGRGRIEFLQGKWIGQTNYSIRSSAMRQKGLEPRHVWRLMDSLPLDPRSWIIVFWAMPEGNLIPNIQNPPPRAVALGASSAVSGKHA